MPAKIIRLGAQAVDPLLRGVNIVADLVAPTLGPAGRTVLAGRTHSAPQLLGGGYAVTRELELAGAGQQMGVLAMRDLAWRLTDEVGDGTGSAILMARAFLGAGLGAARTGLSPAELQGLVEAHLEVVVGELDAAARPVSSEEDYARVATQAAGGDAAIGSRVARVHGEVGDDGLVSFEEGRGVDDEVRVDGGLHFDQGWISPYFADATTQVAEMDDPLILLHLEPVNELGPIVPALEMIAKAGRGLVLIAENVGGDALGALVVNRQRAGLKVAAVKAPGTGPWRQLMLEDIAIATGGTLIAEQLGTRLSGLRPHMLGRARKIRIERRTTTIVGGHGDPAALARRAGEIRSAIAREQHLSFDRDQHRKRLARLQAGLATVWIGGVSSSELARRLDQAKAASAALRAARRGGVAQGGSAALVRAGRRAEAALPQDLMGRMVGRMFAAALQAPLQAIADNAGLDGRAVVRRVAAGDEDTCFDALTRSFVPAETLLDPVAVLRAALTGSVSVASRLLGVEATVALSVGMQKI